MRLLKLLLVLFVCAAGPAVAGPFEDALAAYDKGDYATALRLWRPFANQGYAAAQNNLGFMYEKGEGVPQDYAQALAWYRKAANQGYAAAQFNLGLMYHRGEGVPQDYAQALAWYRKAVANGLSKAQDNITALEALINNSSITVPNAAPTTPPQRSMSGSSIQMKKDRGTYVVPVLINNAITLDFMVDSGASDVSIPEDVVTTLIRAGTIRDTDFIGERTYVLADGSRVKSKTFRIRSLKVGDRVLENVTGSVADKKGTLLLGQSFLGRFKSWSIDNSKHVLVLE